MEYDNVELYMIESSADIALKNLHVIDLYSILRISLMAVRRYYQSNKKWYKKAKTISESEKLKKAHKLIVPILNKLLETGIIKQEDLVRLNYDISLFENEIPHILRNYYYLIKSD